jgi:uncharacterized protein YndB with AHSA1/START domain
MSVKKELSGRRSVQVEVEVPGTPEEVWQAIATGPGISTWFVQAEIEEKDGKPAVLKMTFGPGMDSFATVTGWDPPRQFTAESKDWIPNGPPVATEWIVEGRAGGTCIVRVVHSFFASTDDWDSQLEGTEHGWPTWFRVLKLVLTHFRGQRSAAIRLMGNGAVSDTKAWEDLTRSLGLNGVAAGQQWKRPADVPPFAGHVEHIGNAKDHLFEIVRLNEPAPGIGFLMVHSCFGPVPHIEVHHFLFGDSAAAVAARDEPSWKTWMTKHFPFASSDAGKGA